MSDSRPLSNAADYEDIADHHVRESDARSSERYELRDCSLRLGDRERAVGYCKRHRCFFFSALDTYVRELTGTDVGGGEQMSDSFDSRPATLLDSQRVGELMVQVVAEALKRSTCHDRSKTESPEVEVFDEFTPKLKTSTYGSDEYKAHLKAMGEGLKHHYEVNRHHPEHFRNGVNDMTLVDLIEMLADWKAATERHDDGDLAKSLEIQRERFGLSSQLVGILRNTTEHFGWI